MSIQSELIEAKTSNNLLSVASTKLASLINNYKDFCDFYNILEKNGELSPEAKYWADRGIYQMAQDDLRTVQDDAMRKIKEESAINQEARAIKQEARASEEFATKQMLKKKLPLFALGTSLAMFTPKIMKYFKQKKIHNEIAQEFQNNPEFKDKEKVKSIYDMVTQFAPTASTNPVFSKHVVEHLYNSPLITAPAIKDITEVEKNLTGKGGKDGKASHMDIISAVKMAA